MNSRVLGTFAPLRRLSATAPNSNLKWGLVSDIHFDERVLDRVAECGEWVVETFRLQTVSHIFVCGDVLNTRDSVHIGALNEAMKWIADLSRVAPVSVILGNHDTHLRDSGSISSLDAIAQFQNHLARTRLYKEPSIVVIDGVQCAMLPYALRDDALARFVHAHFPDAESKRRAVAFAHAEIPGAKISRRVDVSRLLSSAEISYTHRLLEDHRALETGPAEVSQEKPASQRGHYLDGFKMAFSGHFHVHQCVRPEIMYVGAPLQHHFGDAGDPRGVLVFDPVRNDVQRILNPKWDVFRHVSVSSQADMDALLTRTDFRGKAVTAVVTEPSLDRNRIQDIIRDLGTISSRVQPMWLSKMTARQQFNVSVGDRTSSGTAVPLRREEWLSSMVQNFVHSALSTSPMSFQSRCIAAGERLFSNAQQGKGRSGGGANVSNARGFVADLKRVGITNFMSCKGEHVLEFSASSDAVWMVTGMNGAGKSLIMEAISWCLFGKLLRSDMAIKDVVNDSCDAESACVVRVSFGNGFEIERRRNRSSRVNQVTVFQDNVELSRFSKGTVGASDEDISLNLLGIDFDTFSRSVIVSEEILSSYFASAGHKDRVLFVEKIFGLGDLDDAHIVCRAQLRQTEEAHERARVQLLEYRRVVRDSEFEFQRLSSSQQELQLHIAESQTMVSTMEGKLAVLQTGLQENAAQSDALFSALSISGVTDGDGDGDAMNMNDVHPLQRRGLLQHEAQRTHVHQQPSSLHLKRSLFLDVHSAFAAYIQKWQRLEDCIETQGSPVVVAVHSANQRLHDCLVSVRSSCIPDGNETPVQCIQNAGQPQPQPQRHESIAELRKRRFTEIQTRNKQALSDFQATLTSLSKAQARLTFLQDEVRRTNSQMSTLLEKSRDEASRISTQETAVSDLADKKNELEFWMEALDRGRKSSGPNADVPATLRSFILKSAVETLNKILAEYSALLFRNTTIPLTVKLDSQLKLLGDIGKRSAGQRKRVDLCILFALFEVLRLNATFQPRFLMLDEVFDSLDDNGQLAILDMFWDLTSRFGSIFVVSHSMQLKALDSRSMNRIAVSFDARCGTHFQTVVHMKKTVEKMLPVESSIEKQL
ncbi:conserved mitochondrial MPP superfamily/AAA_23/ABC_ATPase domains-containing protein [Andalucia godoyi]|uniref:Conserved mitochondrial MPP superfamily/AAA_23/ABC_ATPase domains-containing protein n=1 Tax=Andalucia godoyi TaxID=505711 RepID=A0A8K0F1A7_ANDGO|nr:conserved mitochondrial MPP superfamily/AAA_23/ABC_ATPase domains-containing protein [Andalucia godoyi]|eukprot:ANDGO_03038.mRNA.1 conserved mitochondrial MPP superfamily/AAA_23/ABC_ATPase domains-containing protein